MASPIGGGGNKQQSFINVYGAIKVEEPRIQGVLASRNPNSSNLTRFLVL